MTGLTDCRGWLLLTLLAVVAVAAGAALIRYGHLSPWGLAFGLFICVAFVTVDLPVQISHGPKNTFVHGAAKAASELEAKAAARGDKGSPALHDRTFLD